MTASSRGGIAVSALLKASPRVCSQCAAVRFRPAASRPYTTAAAAAAATDSLSPKLTDANPPPTNHVHAEPAQPPSSAGYRIKSGVMLSRPPLLTRPQTDFESAFYLYQKRLNERLALPFRQGFYYRRDTAAELDWRLKFAERGRVVAKELGTYKPRGRAGWDDEVLVGSRLADPASVRDALLRDAETRVSEDGERLPPDERVPVERPLPRRTEADERNDVRRLDRMLDRTLYLVVKGKDGAWTFPAGVVETDDTLHEVASKVLEASAGVNMNTWMVGRAPVAHFIRKPVFPEEPSKEPSDKERGEKIFFLKARIMAGQADLKDNTMGLVDFNWLCREELEKALAPEYYHGVWRALADR